MGDDSDAIFADKENDVDWDMVLGLKQEGTLAKLQQAEKNGDAQQYDTLVTEALKQYAAICSFKVNKDDAKTDVENLSFLFEFTQALLEVKARGLKLEEESAKKAKDKNKKQREEIKEYMARIEEQDTEIQEQLQMLQQSVSSPQKGGKGGEATRNDNDYKNLQKTLEATREQLTSAQRDLQEEKRGAKDQLERERTAKDDRDRMQKELEEAQGELEQMQRNAQDNAKREQNTRKQSQKVQKETFKFVKEVSELNEKVCLPLCPSADCLAHCLSFCSLLLAPCHLLTIRSSVLGTWG